MAEQVQEAWNMATQTLKRLSRCLDLCSFYSQHKDLAKWYNASLDLRRNLYPFLEDEEYKQLNTLDSMPAFHNGRPLPKDFIKAYKILDDFYMIAIKFMRAKGLLMPKAKDPRLAVIDL